MKTRKHFPFVAQWNTWHPRCALYRLHYNFYVCMIINFIAVLFRWLIGVGMELLLIGGLLVC